MPPIRLVLFGIFTFGAVVYAVWTRFGWLAAGGTLAGLLLMVGGIFGIGRRERSGSVLQEIRRKAAKRWVCRVCGTQGAPKSTMCMKCGADIGSGSK